MIPVLVLAAAAAASKPPAKLVVPQAMRDARNPDSQYPPVPLSVFATPDVIEALGPPRTLVGSWAEYTVRSEGLEDMRMRLSILPPALEGGRYWLELDVISETGAPTAIRMLVHGNPARPQDLERATLYMQGHAALELPLGEVDEELSKEPPVKPSGAKLRQLKRETVTTPAGTFVGADVSEIANTRLWRSEKVPLWGLIRSKNSGQTVELVGYSTAGAHTLVQGKGSESTK